MASSKINVFVTSIAGTGLPPTLSLALSPSTTITELRDELDQRLPLAASTSRLLITTISNRQLPTLSSSPIASLLPPTTTSQNVNDFLSLRLSLPLCGGKGGFGSQLRAAGGRMSSNKKKKNGQVEENGSSRNLDGRRLRTVTEAKALAEYLAIKPEMERREKEKRMARWAEIVELTERRQEEIKYGKRAGPGSGLDGKWVEEKEETGERTREAVLAAMRRGGYVDNLAVLSAGDKAMEDVAEVDEEEEEEEESEEGEQSVGSKATTPPSEPEPTAVKKMDKGKEKETTTRKFIGFDDEDEFMSSDEE